MALGAALCLDGALAGPLAAAPTVGGDAAGPQVHIIQPGYNDVLKGSTGILIAVQVTKFNAQSIEMFVDDRPGTTGPLPLAAAASSQFNWDTRQFSDGPHKLTVQVTDTQGFRGWAEVNVYINNGHVTSTVPPKLAWSNLQNGQEISGNVQITLDAINRFGVKWIVVSVNPSNDPNRKPPLRSWLLNRPPYSVNFDSTQVPDGSYVGTGTAFDALEQEGNAPEVTFRVNNTGAAINPTTLPPNVGLPVIGADHIESQASMSGHAGANRASTSGTSAASGQKGTPEYAEFPAPVSAIPHVDITIPRGAPLGGNSAHVAGSSASDDAAVSVGLNPNRRTVSQAAPAPPISAQSSPVRSGPVQSGPVQSGPVQTAPVARVAAGNAPPTSVPVRIAANSGVESGTGTLDQSDPPANAQTVIASAVGTSPFAAWQANGAVGAHQLRTEAPEMGSRSVPSTSGADVLNVAPNATVKVAPKVAPNANVNVGSNVAPAVALNVAPAVALNVAPVVAPSAAVRGIASMPVAPVGSSGATSRPGSVAGFSVPGNNAADTLPTEEVSSRPVVEGSHPLIAALPTDQVPLALPFLSPVGASTAARTRIVDVTTLKVEDVPDNQRQRFAMLDLPAGQSREVAPNGHAQLSGFAGSTDFSTAALPAPLKMRAPLNAAQLRWGQPTGSGRDLASFVPAAMSTPVGPKTQAFVPRQPKVMVQLNFAPSAGHEAEPESEALRGTPGQPALSASVSVNRSVISPSVVTKVRPLTQSAEPSASVPASGLRIAALPRTEMSHSGEGSGSITVAPMAPGAGLAIPAFHRVERSTTLRAVAARYGLPADVVARCNDWPVEMRLVSGMTVRLPRELQVSYQGQPVKSDVASLLAGSTTITPFRFLWQQQGGTLDWDAAKHQVTARNKGQEIVLTIGSRTAKVDNKDVMMELAAFLMSGRTMVPIRFFEQGLHAHVDWDPSTGRMYVAMAG